MKGHIIRKHHRLGKLEDDSQELKEHPNAPIFLDRIGDLSPSPQSFAYSQVVNPIKQFYKRYPNYQGGRIV